MLSMPALVISLSSLSSRDVVLWVRKSVKYTLDALMFFPPTIYHDVPE